MDAPEPLHIDPLHAIRGAAADIVLRDGKLPEIPFDRRRPCDELSMLVRVHLETVVRPRVDVWLRDRLPDDTMLAAHGLVGRYNEVLRLHPGEHIHAMDFASTRPPMDPFEAMAHQVDIEPDAKRAAQLGDAAGVAEHGPAASLDFARMRYVQMLRETRMGLAQMYVPNQPKWRDDVDRKHWQRVGHANLQVLPFVYRNAEEFLALHMVDGAVPDLATPPPPRAPGIPENNLPWKESLQENGRYTRLIAAYKRRAERVLEEFRDYLRVDAGRGTIGKLLAAVGNWFPVDDCRRLAAMLHNEQRLTKAQELNDALHETWRNALELSCQPDPRVVRDSYREVAAALHEFGTLLESLVDRVLGGYEGK